MPSQFGRVLVVTVMTVLVILFAAIYARDRRSKAWLWLLGWISIEVHFAANLAGNFGLLPNLLRAGLAYATLIVTAGCFFLSVSNSCYTTRLRVAFWTFVAAPTVVYWTLLAAGINDSWPYRLLFLALSTGGCTVTYFSERQKAVVRDRTATLRFWTGVGAVAAVGVIFAAWMPAPGYGVALILAMSFYGCAVAYWFHHRRTTPGVLFTCLSLFLWGSVWPSALAVRAMGIAIPGDSFLWDMPKYFVAFGMIVTLLEDKSAALAGEIKEREQAEAALRETSRWLRETQEASRIGSLTYDLATGRWTTSAALDEILGLTPGYDKTREALLALVAPGDAAELERYVRDAIAHGENFDRELTIVRPSDGGTRWVHARGALMHDVAGHDAGWAGTVQDITERKRVEEELRQAHRLESLGRLAGGVAHDFNNLLTVVNGYSDLVLTTAALDETTRGYVREVRAAGERAAELTNQLLTFSRRQVVQPRLIELNVVLGAASSMLRRLVGEHISVELRLADKLDYVLADAGQIDQVLVNLAVNAREAMPQGGRLLIATENVELQTSDLSRPGRHRAGRYVRIGVTDTGSGMDEQTAAHLFEPFFTTKLLGKGGAGLGLPAVYGIVHQSGGWIDVRSQIGIGTSFRIYLPAAEAPPLPLTTPANAAQPEPAPAAPTVERTVLLVEDQDNVRELTASVLRSIGYRVLEASGGEQALTLSASHQGDIHLVLSDVVMPRMPGPVVVESLKLQRPELRVLYMSGYTDDVVVHHGVSVGEMELLQKPFTPDQLARSIRKALGQHA